MIELATAGGDAHSIAIWVLGSLAAAGALLVLRLLWKAGTATSKIIRFVLPHFEPPTEMEIREGKKDVTLPARLHALEDNAHELSERLTAHMEADEVTNDATDKRLSLIESAVIGGRS